MRIRDKLRNTFIRIIARTPLDPMVLRTLRRASSCPTGISAIVNPQLKSSGSRMPQRPLISNIRQISSA